MMNFSCSHPLRAHPTGPETAPARTRPNEQSTVHRRQSEPAPGSRAAYGMLCDVISRSRSGGLLRDRDRGKGCGLGPTPAGADACVNQRNGTLVLAHMGTEMACWWAISLARFLELTCALLAAAKSILCVLAGGTISVVSVCPSVTGFIAIINLIFPATPAQRTRTRHPLRMLHLRLAVFIIKFLLCFLSLILLIRPLCVRRLAKMFPLCSRVQSELVL